MLFALTELDYPTPALRRVAAVAAALDGDLHVLRVLSSPSHVGLRSPSPGSDDSRVSERARLARRGTAAWWGRTLLQPCIEESIQVRIGDFVTEVSAHAHVLGAACVVLAPARAGWAGTMTALLRACRQPVFSTPGASQHWAALLAVAKAAGSQGR